jgi:hypothetical protein
MNNSKYYPLALEALAELATEMSVVQNTGLSVQLPLESVLAEIGPLPDGALFLGMAEDELPVLLNLYDPTPGPLLLIGDAESGKTAFLKMMARVIAESHDTENLQFSICTETPHEWSGLDSLPHCAGLASVRGDDGRELVHSLYAWAHENPRAQQVVLFLLDGLDKAGDWDEVTKSQLRWLLLRGPSRRIWPILTVNATLFPDVKEWLPSIHTFIHSKVSDTSLAEMLSGGSNAKLGALRAGMDFTMKEGTQWLKFWIPRTE